MKTTRHQAVARRKRRIGRRLRPRTWTAQAKPMYTASQIHYEHSDRVRGLATGGIGAMHRLAQHVGSVDAIDRHVELLQVEGWLYIARGAAPAAGARGPAPAAQTAQPTGQAPAAVCRLRVRAAGVAVATVQGRPIR